MWLGGPDLQDDLHAREEVLRERDTGISCVRPRALRMEMRCGIPSPVVDVRAGGRGGCVMAVEAERQDVGVSGSQVENRDERNDDKGAGEEQQLSRSHGCNGPFLYRI